MQNRKFFPGINLSKEQGGKNLLMFASFRILLILWGITGAVFNIKGNQYRLIVDIFYAFGDNHGTVLIKWFGTHKEYDKIDVREL